MSKTQKPADVLGALAAAIASAEQNQARLANLAMTAANLEDYLAIDQGLGDDEDQAWRQFREACYSLIALALGHEQAAPARYHLFINRADPYQGSFFTIAQACEWFADRFLGSLDVEDFACIFYEQDGQAVMLAAFHPVDGEWTMLHKGELNGDPHALFGAIASQNTCWLFAGNGRLLFQTTCAGMTEAKRYIQAHAEQHALWKVFCVQADGTLNFRKFTRSTSPT